MERDRVTALEDTQRGQRVEMSRKLGQARPSCLQHGSRVSAERGAKRDPIGLLSADREPAGVAESCADRRELASIPSKDGSGVEGEQALMELCMPLAPFSLRGTMRANECRFVTGERTTNGRDDPARAVKRSEPALELQP